MDRYQKQVLLPQIGQAGQEKIHSAKVLIVGLGGLGAAALPYLTSSGIGYLGLMDGDVVEKSNLARQVIYGLSDIGKMKVESAAVYIEQQNSDVQVKKYPYYLNDENAKAIIQNYDIVLDCSDNLATRYCINDGCVALDKVMVYGGVYRWEGQVSVFNYQDGPTYRCLFEEETGHCEDCNQSGVMGTTVAIVAMLQTNEVFKIILETGSVLSGKLLLYNMLSNEQTILKFSKKQPLPSRAIESRVEFKGKKQLSKMNLSRKIQSDCYFIDVRESHEKPKIDSDKVIEIPLRRLDSDYIQLDVNKSYQVFCQSGHRSRQAVAFLKEHSPLKVTEVEGGVFSIIDKEENE